MYDPLFVGKTFATCMDFTQLQFHYRGSAKFFWCSLAVLPVEAIHYFNDDIENWCHHKTAKFSSGLRFAEPYVEQTYRSSTFFMSF